MKHRQMIPLSLAAAAAFLPACDLTNPQPHKAMVASQRIESPECPGGPAIGEGARGLFRLELLRDHFKGQLIPFGKGFLNETPLPKDVDPYAVLDFVPRSFRQQKKIQDGLSLKDYGASLEVEALPIPLDVSHHEVKDLRELKTRLISAAPAGKKDISAEGVLKFTLENRAHKGIYVTAADRTERVDLDTKVDQALAADEETQGEPSAEEDAPAAEASSPTAPERSARFRTLLTRFRDEAEGTLLALPGNPEPADKPYNRGDTVPKAELGKPFVLAVAPDSAAPAGVTSFLQVLLVSRPSKTQTALCVLPDAGGTINVPTEWKDPAGRPHALQVGNYYMMLSRIYQQRIPMADKAGGDLYVETASGVITAASVKEKPKPKPPGG